MVHGRRGRRVDGRAVGLSMRKGSFIRLIHPFAFDDAYEAILGSIERTAMWSVLEEPRQYLMPHVRSHINSIGRGSSTADASELLRVLVSDARKFPVHGPCTLELSRNET